MGITLFGRGVPLSAVDDGTNMQVAYAGTTILDISSSGLSGTFSTIKTTSITGTTISGTALCGTTVSGTTVYATDISGTHTSAGGTEWQFMSAGAGKCVCAHDVGNVANVSADAAMLVIFKGTNFYIPAFSAIAKQS